ncbi:MAG: N-6 DNA methylase [Methanomassiliicoccaceae archaeon]|nr:N-6 DNA methylase [Methanomassiliicoccaceae archaeon]
MDLGTSDGRSGIIRSLTYNRRLEDERGIIQAELDEKKTLEERRRLGQFSTPSELAQEIVAYSLTLLDNNEQISFFDPALGTGAFYSALLRLCENKRIDSATGVEIDPHYAIPAKDLWQDSGLEVIISDFTRIDLVEKCNLLICNPPYVRHHLLNQDDKQRIKERTRRLTNVNLSGLAGLYCHFLLQSVQTMKENGIAAWLIPSEFMDVNYGVKLKQFLLSEVELLRIHRFNPADVQFSDALVSSAVVWFRKKRPMMTDSIEFSFGGTLHSPNIARKVPRDDLKSDLKWTPIPFAETVRRTEESVRLSDCFDVKRGIATGNNGFFILEKATIEKLGLPSECFRPILPSARYLEENEIKADELGNPLLRQQLFLLDCRLPEHEVEEKYPQLWQYLCRGKDEVAAGYLCRSRKCWYYQEQREAPLYICTYMGRKRGSNDKAFRFIYNESDAVVTNSYLGLYPKGWLRSELQKDPSLGRTIWELLNDIEPASLVTGGRVYGGGLHKIEPAELLGIAFPQMESLFARRPHPLPRRGSAADPLHSAAMLVIE